MRCWAWAESLEESTKQVGGDAEGSAGDLETIQHPQVSFQTRDAVIGPPLEHRAPDKIEQADESHYDGDDEPMSVGARFGQHLGLLRLGIHHERLLPGRRTSYPHAESAEEEFVYVIAGTPDVWIDGELHGLHPGDAVGFPAGTGICHSFLNNSAREVRLLVTGEAHKPENRVFYPRNPEQATRKDWWSDAPSRAMGDHDGLTNSVRARAAHALVSPAGSRRVPAGFATWGSELSRL